MQVEVIDDVEGFARVRANWDAVYEADPESQFFLSWTWLSIWFKNLDGGWFILAAKSNGSASPYVGFFPLRLRTETKSKGGAFYNEINMAGNYAADYTGLICAPEFQDRVIPAFAKYLKQQRWTSLHLENLRASKERARLLLQHFSGKKFVTKEEERFNERDKINNLICPAISLPGDWDSYLSRLSSNTRQKARRFLRQLDSSSEFHITHGGAETIERDLKILFEFWAKKWGPRKGERLRNIVNMNRKMLTLCAEGDALFMPVLWRRDTPLGTLASFVDRQKKSLLFYMGARDESCETPPPGFLLHAHSLRYAISNGFTTYDFLRGNEPYKYSFGAEERRIRCIVVSTRNQRNTGDKLDDRSIPIALQRATEFHESGRLPEAERVYRQVLDVEPQNATALYCYAQLTEKNGRHGAAKRTYKALLAVRPDSEKAWLGLGRTLEARSEFAAAADAFREVIKRKSEFLPAHYSLSNVLFKLSKHDEALAILKTALLLRPDLAKGQTIWTAALSAVAKLSAQKRRQCALLGADMGDRMSEHGELAFAVACYRQALDMQPDLVVAHYGLALALERQGDLEGAEQSCRTALDYEPDHRDARALVSKLALRTNALGQAASLPRGQRGMAGSADGLTDLGSR